MKQRIYRSILLFFLFGAPFAVAQTITYNINWTASGTYAFQDAFFKLSLTGNTSNVTGDPSVGTINEGMTGSLLGPYSAVTTYTDQFLGIQPLTNPSQSIIWGGVDSGAYNIILDFGAVSSGLSTYDLKSAVGPTNLSGEGLVGNPNKFIFATASGFKFEAVPGADGAITYNFGWTASGTYAFQSASFRLSLAGDTSNVTGDPSVGTINEGMTGSLLGPYGAVTTYTDQFLGIQPLTNPSQSIIWGGVESGAYNMILDQDALSSGLSTYDLKSAVGPTGLSGGGFVGNPSGFIFTSASDFSFEAVTTVSVPEQPSTFLLVGISMIGLAGLRRVLRKLCGC